MKEIAIRKGAVRSAAMWINMNNPYLRDNDLDHLETKIQNHVDIIVSKAMKLWEMTYIASGGWTVLFSPEDKNYGIIEILCDVQVGRDFEYEYI